MTEEQCPACGSSTCPNISDFLKQPDACRIIELTAERDAAVADNAAIICKISEVRSHRISALTEQEDDDPYQDNGPEAFDGFAETALQELFEMSHTDHPGSALLAELEGLRKYKERDLKCFDEFVRSNELEGDLNG